MPNIKNGGRGTNFFKDTSATDIYHGMGGDDWFDIRMRNPSQEPRDEFYGDEGRDHFNLWLRGETFEGIQSGRLEAPLISGGAGGDTLSISVGRIDQELYLQNPHRLLDYERIERVDWSVGTSADVIGSSYRDNVSWAGMRHKADIYAGAGNDQVRAFAVSDGVELRGQAGSDVLSGISESNKEMPALFGGSGDDYFFCDMWSIGRGWRGAMIADYDRKEDHILIQTKSSYEYLPYINVDDAHHSWKQFRDHVTYDDGEIRVNGRLAFIVEGAPDLQLGDFLFI